MILHRVEPKTYDLAKGTGLKSLILHRVATSYVRPSTDMQDLGVFGLGFDKLTL